MAAAAEEEEAESGAKDDGFEEGDDLEEEIMQEVEFDHVESLPSESKSRVHH